MQYALISLISIIIGVVIGFLYQKSLAQKIIIEREILAKEVELLKTQGNNFDRFQEESLKSAKAVMFEASRDVAAKLIEDHKREAGESRKAAEEVTQKTTAGLQLEFKAVIEKLAGLNAAVEKQDVKVTGLWQALSNPTGAGQFAEIGLENTLKNFGLEKDRDFITQFSVNYDGARLRPDAVIFLPDGNLMVIDAKSSKFFLELAEADDEALILEKLKRTMNLHLNGLASKDYYNAVRQTAKSEHATIVNVMFVPSESARTKIQQADGEFAKKCMAKNILFADPAGIELLLHVARYQIGKAKQEVNYHMILKETGKVISSVDNLIRNLDAVGKSIKKSAEYFGALGNSVNSRLLPRMRRVIELGLETEKEMKLPASLPNFNIVESDPVVIIEAEGYDEPVKLFAKK